jgi:hypothetical protein
VDYRELLKKYLEFILGWEGTYFLGMGRTLYKDFSDEEFDEINRLADELDEGKAPVRRNFDNPKNWEKL